MFRRSTALLLAAAYAALAILVAAGTLALTVVLFIPDGIVGTAQKLMARFGGTRAPERVAARAEEAKTVEAGRTP